MEEDINKLLEDINLSVLNTLCEKGMPTILSGITGCGKSMLIANLAKNEAVKDLLKTRCSSPSDESLTKATTEITKVIVTDYEGIPDDILVYKFVLKNFNKIIKSESIKDFVFTCLNEYDTISHEGELSCILKNGRNHTLAYKIDKMTSLLEDTDQQKYCHMIFECVKKISNEYDKYKNNQDTNTYKKYKESVEFKKNFKRKFIESKHMESFLTNIEEICKEIFEKCIVKEKILLEHRTEIQIDKETNSYTLFFKNKKDEWCEKFLSPKKSLEFLFSNICLIFRGKETFFNNTNDKFTVIKQTNKDIHSIPIIDTMGVLHDGKDVDKDYDILSNYTNYMIQNINLLYIINSQDILNNSENNLQFLANLLKSTKPFKIHILFTHFFQMKDMIGNNPNSEVTKGPEEIAKEKLELFYNNEKLRNIPNIKSEDILIEYFVVDFSNKCDADEIYSSAKVLPNLFKSIANKVIFKSKDKIYIKKEINSYNEIQEINFGFKNEYAITKVINSIQKCAKESEEFKNIHWNTAEACINHWCYIGTPFYSQAKFTTNINTIFVYEIYKFITDILRKSLNDINIIFKDYKFLISSEPEAQNKFNEILKNFLENYLYILSNYATKNIGEKAYASAQTKMKNVFEFKRQKIFLNMMRYTITEIFKVIKEENNISEYDIYLKLNDEDIFVECLKNAIKQTVDLFEKWNCITVIDY